VSVTINGNTVDPASYVLREGDTIEIVVETSG
jgi:ribosomal protein S4